MKTEHKITFYLLGFLISLSAVAVLMGLFILLHLWLLPAEVAPPNISDLISPYGTVAAVVVALTIAIISWLRESAESRSRETQKSEYLLLLMDEELQKFYYICEGLYGMINSMILRFNKEPELETIMCGLSNGVWNLQNASSRLIATNFSVVENDLNVLENTDFEISRAILKCIQNKSIIERELRLLMEISPSYGQVTRGQMDILNMLSKSISRARNVNDYLRPKYIHLNK